MNKKLTLIIILGVLLFIQPLSAQTWSAAKRLTWTTGTSAFPVVAVDNSDRIHVVWKDKSLGVFENYYKRSTNGGMTWSTAKRLTWNADIGSNPSIAIESINVILVVWTNNNPGGSDVLFKRSTDGGTTWQATKRLTWTSGDSFSPTIAADTSGRVHLVWYDDTHGNLEIYYKRSTNDGTNWQSTKRLTWSSVNSFSSSIAVDSSNGVHIVWVDGNEGEESLQEIYYKRSTNAGVTWLATKRLTWNNSASFNPSIAVDPSNRIHISYTDEAPGNGEIYYKKSKNSGVTWDLTKRLTWNSGSSSSPCITVDSSNRVYVAWNDISPGNYEIYYRRSTNGGVMWQTSKRLTWSPAGSFVPSMATDSSDGIHVVWEDFNPGNAEIYYKKGIQ